MRHLLSAADLSADEVASLLDVAEEMHEVQRRPIKKLPALRGRTIINMFFEDSTRTRTSFDTAAKRLSADTMNFAVSSSSVNKGESLRDTIETISAMGVDAFVVRHKSSGMPGSLTKWTGASIVNAGDGWHQHPTQALLDCYTIRTQLARTGERPFEGLHIAIVGDIKHSRVARSDVLAFTALGARVTLVAPGTLLPSSLAGWPVEVSHRLDDVIGEIDVAYMLRMQLERQEQALVPSLREYTSCFGLTPARAARLSKEALIMHPGPMNRGVEIGAEVADDDRAVITTQVANGVAVRMAVLFRLLGGPR